jgi:hypothetical protein
MEKEFVPYELALRMKQLGFDEPCFAYYDMAQEFNFPGCTMHNRNFINLKATMTSLYQQAFRWFREKHDLLNDVGISANRKNDTKKWMYSIIYLDKNTYIYSEETYNTYEEAELACLKKLIEIVKEK